MDVIGTELARLHAYRELVACMREALQTRSPHLVVREYVPPILGREDQMEVRFSTARADADQLQFANASSSSADQEAPEGPATGYAILIDKNGLGDYRLKPHRILANTKRECGRRQEL